MPSNDTTHVPEPYKHCINLRRAQCVEASGRSVAFFDKLAWKGEGPKFFKPGGHRSPALYPTSEFFAWLDAYMKGGTSNA